MACPWKTSRAASVDGKRHAHRYTRIDVILSWKNKYSPGGFLKDKQTANSNIYTFLRTWQINSLVYSTVYNPVNNQIQKSDNDILLDKIWSLIAKKKE